MKIRFHEFFLPFVFLLSTVFSLVLTFLLSEGLATPLVFSSEFLVAISTVMVLVKAEIRASGYNQTRCLI